MRIIRNIDNPRQRIAFGSLEAAVSVRVRAGCLRAGGTLRERVAVIGTAKDIPWGEVITQADLMQVMVALEASWVGTPIHIEL